ncbi:MAG: RNA ligase family protein [Saprospiraceae bacterium]|nr:RNA ligase family protein [Saprospiraceae bacterium]
MSLSRKYGRTYHYPFSPGTSSDDRINANYWEEIRDIAEVVHTEKLDGENTCLNQYGVFARSHAAPTRHPWASYLKERWEAIRNDLGELEIFGENLYAVHSIRYEVLEHHFFVFAVRELDRWLSWEEVKFYAGLLDFPVVPEIMRIQPTNRDQFEEQVLAIVGQESTFSSVDVHTNEACRMEGIVTRNAESFSTEHFRANVFKYVRKDHVKTDEHWTRRWQRAPLKWEKSCGD